MKGTELIVVEKLKTDILFYEDGILEKVLDGIKSKIDEFEPDLETAASRKEIASMSRKVSSSKTFLDSIRKETIADAKAKIDKANGIWKPAEEKLNKWRDEVRQPLTDWEAEQERIDQERIAKIKGEIDSWTNAYHGMNGTGKVGDLKEYISKLETVRDLISPELYFEFTGEAIETCNNLLSRAKQDLDNRIRLDKEEAERKAEAERLAAERAELEAKRKEQEERDRLERERQEAEAAKLKADQDRIEAWVREQNEQIENEKRKLIEESAKLERAKFEKLRKEQEERDREEFERQAKIKAEAEAKAAAEREKLRKEEAIRQEALRPDKEKLAAFAQFLMEGMTYPNVKSAEASELIQWAYGEIAEISETIFEKSEKL